MTTILALWLALFSGVTDPSPTVEVRSMTGEWSRGRWRALEADGTIIVVGADGVEKRLRQRETASLLFPQTKMPAGGAAAHGLRFELVGGDVIVGVIVEATFDDVRVKSSALADTVKVPLDRVRLVVVNDNAGPLLPTFGDDVAKDRDVLFMRTRDGIDHVVGEVTKLDVQAVQFTWGDKQESTFAFAKDKVIALRLAADPPPARSREPYAIVHLRDGGVLSGVLTKKADGPAVIDLGGGLSASLREEEIVEVTFVNGDFAFLSDLGLPEVRETPYVAGGLKYGLGLDHGQDGGPLTIGDEFFSKGIAMHSRTEATWTLDGKWKTFASAIGIDGSVAGRPMRGAVAFSVKVDDAVVFGPKICRAGEIPVWTGPIDVTKKSKLTLIADFADNMHFNGRAIWGAARVVKATP